MGAAAVPLVRRIQSSRLQATGVPPVPPELPEGRVLTLPGRGEVFYRDSAPPERESATPGSGDAVPALLLHGWTVTADLNWFPVFGPLTGERRVIAPDHRGHGRGIRSEERFSLEHCADDAAALLDALGVGRVVAVGYSMGGPIAMLLARRRPELVAGLVVEATALEWSASLWERERWRAVALIELGMRVGAGESVVSRMLGNVGRHRPELAPLGPWMAGEFRRGDPGVIADAGRSLASYDARSWAPTLGVPAVSVITTRDRLVPVVKQRNLAEALGAKVIEIPADHNAPLLEGAALGSATREAIGIVAEAAG